MITRRLFLTHATAGIAGTISAARCLAASPPDIRIGSCLIGSMENARDAGLQGIELNAGKAADRLEIADPAARANHKAKMKETGIAVSSIMMGLFNSFPLASDPRGPAWLEQTIEAAADLGAGVILVAFFGKGSLLDEQKQVKKADVDVVVERIRAAAPAAKKAGVILGIENTLSAQHNIEILNRIGHESVKIYYDIFNLYGQGYDVPAEIRLLKDRIAIFHFKNGPDYLDNGKVKFEPAVAAIKEIGYRGWIVLETSSPSKDKVADGRRNAAHVRKLFGLAT
ncbi:MAG TPA: sugar phosphate isomerase/epimerase family protein [Verrucomicrobiae bacterium]|nr:sugar phosphate isomerase/epimerase family protein [Verrucomicrobiae bacterium]